MSDIAIEAIPQTDLTDFDEDLEWFFNELFMTDHPDVFRCQFCHCGPECHTMNMEVVGVTRSWFATKLRKRLGVMFCSQCQRNKDTIQVVCYKNRHYNN